MTDNMRTKFMTLPLLFLLGGCSMIAAPIDLLRPPASAHQLDELRTAIAPLLPPGSKLTSPVRADEDIGAIHMIDLDGDGINEAIAFYKLEKKYELGAIVMAMEDHVWKQLGTISGVGIEIDRLLFEDVTGDGYPEILIGWSGGPGLDRELSIAQLRQRQLNTLGTLSYSELAIGDMNGDGIPDIAAVKFDRVNMKSEAILYSLKDGVLRKAGELPLFGGINGYIQATIGQVAENQSGLLLEAGLGAHSSYTTLIIWKDNQLVSVFGQPFEDHMVLFKPYPTLSQDIDGDGIIEFDLLREPPGIGNTAMANISWIHSWHKWDGHKGLVRVFENYYDFNTGYRLDFPESWWDHISLYKEENRLRVEYYNQELNENAEMFSIHFQPFNEMKHIRKEWDTRKIDYVSLAETFDTWFAATWPEHDVRLSEASLMQYKQFMPDQQTIRKYFQLISRR